FLPLAQLDRYATGERLEPHAALCIDVTRWPLLRERGRRIAQDHDRKLEALRRMHRHDAHALGAFLDDRRVRLSTAPRVVLELVDERAERGRTAGLEATREVDHPQYVRERLLAGRPHGEPGVRARDREQARDRVRD